MFITMLFNSLIGENWARLFDLGVAFRSLFINDDMSLSLCSFPGLPDDTFMGLSLNESNCDL